MSANLMLHCGARQVTIEELAAVPTPERTRTWNPVSHINVLRTAVDTLRDAGYNVTRSAYGLSADGTRFFGTLDLTTPLSPDGTITLAVGLRNSTNKTFPMGFCAGSRVFVCDNLAFRADLMVRRKHTVNGQALFSADIGNSVLQLPHFAEGETKRIAAMQADELSAMEADSIILRSATEKGIIPVTAIPHVVKHWNEPLHEEFKPRTAWSLFNAYTSALGNLKEKNPNDLARRTMRLSVLLTNAI